jgi:hypothetical protein
VWLRGGEDVCGVWAAVLLWLAEGVGIISRPLSRRVVRSLGTLKVGSFSPVKGKEQQVLGNIATHHRLLERPIGFIVQCRVV